MGYESDYNYHSDHRVQAAKRGKWYDSIDEKRMRATVTFFRETDEGGEEETREVPIEFQVCPTCRGTGTHVNPSIDCDGLTAEDFAEDPDLMEMYCGGVYDVDCYECDNKRVVPVCADPEVCECLAKMEESRRETEAIYLAERRMGA